MSPHEDEPEFTLKPLSLVRKTIADRVLQSFHDIPQFDLHLDVDASALVSTKCFYINKRKEVIPTYNDMLIFCVSRVLVNHPELNAHFTAEGIKEFKEINIGFAAATTDGVFLPVIRRANTKSLKEIAKSSADLVRLARNNQLRASRQMYGTFTLSSLGGYGIDSFNAIINPPQVAILAVGAIVKKPCIKDKKIFPADILHLTLTVDHRVVDGAHAASFLFELGREIHDFNVKKRRSVNKK